MSSFFWTYGREHRVENPPASGGYVIVVFETDSVYVPGDERSRTHPGHGYPARTEHFKTPKIYLFEDREKWAEALGELFKEKPGRQDIWAFQAGEPAKPRLRVEI